MRFEKFNRVNEKTPYTSPRAKVVEFNVQGAILQDSTQSFSFGDDSDTVTPGAGDVWDNN